MRNLKATLPHFPHKTWLQDISDSAEDSPGCWLIRAGHRGGMCFYINNKCCAEMRWKHINISPISWNQFLSSAEHINSLREISSVILAGVYIAWQASGKAARRANFLHGKLPGKHRGILTCRISHRSCRTTGWRLQAPHATVSCCTDFTPPLSKITTLQFRASADQSCRVHSLLLCILIYVVYSGKWELSPKWHGLYDLQWEIFRLC